jgi:hypothetical protein
MQNDDLDRKMGRAGQDDDLGKQDFGRETPGRNPQYDQQTGQKGAGQKNKPIHTEEEEDDFGVGGSPGNARNKNK